MLSLSLNKLPVLHRGMALNIKSLFSSSAENKDSVFRDMATMKD